jgi:hypothetical protein
LKDAQINKKTAATTAVEGAFSEEEDALLLDAVGANSDAPWSTIAGLMNRTTDSIKSRWHTCLFPMVDDNNERSVPQAKRSSKRVKKHGEDGPSRVDERVGESPDYAVDGKFLEDYDAQNAEDFASISSAPEGVAHALCWTPQVRQHGNAQCVHLLRLGTVNDLSCSKISSQEDKVLRHTIKKGKPLSEASEHIGTR